MSSRGVISACIVAMPFTRAAGVLCCCCHACAWVSYVAAVMRAQECDDGNGAANDGCSPSCSIEEVCAAAMARGRMTGPVVNAHSDADCLMIPQIKSRASGVSARAKARTPVRPYAGMAGVWQTKSATMQTC